MKRKGKKVDKLSNASDNGPSRGKDHYRFCGKLAETSRSFNKG